MRKFLLTQFFGIKNSFMTRRRILSLDDESLTLCKGNGDDIQTKNVKDAIGKSRLICIFK